MNGLPPVPADEQPHVLVVDDDARLRGLIRSFLADNGFLVTTAANAGAARECLDLLAFDILVLDVMMPGESGVALTRALRGTSETPILLLTARGEPEDRIAGLEAGADDYLGKPFEPRELLLRMNAILRRRPRAREGPPPIRLGRWRFDVERLELQSDTETVRLTDVEASLLKVLAAAPHSIVHRDDLAERSAVPIAARSIDVQVTRLRRKIEDDPRVPRYLQTVRGVGYVLRPD